MHTLTDCITQLFNLIKRLTDPPLIDITDRDLNSKDTDLNLALKINSLHRDFLSYLKPCNNYFYEYSGINNFL